MRTHKDHTVGIYHSTFVWVIQIWQFPAAHICGGADAGVGWSSIPYYRDSEV